MDDPCNPVCLIGCQCVHGVDEDGLHPRVAGLCPAVVDGRIKEALGLAGTCPGGDDCGPPAR